MFRLPYIIALSWENDNSQEQRDGKKTASAVGLSRQATRYAVAKVFKEALVNGSVVGTHAGPDAVAVAFSVQNELQMGASWAIINKKNYYVYILILK